MKKEKEVSWVVDPYLGCNEALRTCSVTYRLIKSRFRKIP